MQARPPVVESAGRGGKLYVRNGRQNPEEQTSLTFAPLRPSPLPNAQPSPLSQTNRLESGWALTMLSPESLCLQECSPDEAIKIPGQSSTPRWRRQHRKSPPARPIRPHPARSAPIPAPIPARSAPLARSAPPSGAPSFFRLSHGMGISWSAIRVGLK